MGNMTPPAIFADVQAARETDSQVNAIPITHTCFGENDTKIGKMFLR